MYISPGVASQPRATTVPPPRRPWKRMLLRRMRRGEFNTNPLSVLMLSVKNNTQRCEDTRQFMIFMHLIIRSQGSQSKKGEDLTFIKIECQRVFDGVTTYSVFFVILVLLKGDMLSLNIICNRSFAD
ncbi:putative protein phosphatase 2C 12 isoform X2 [Salvia divinorum]|uniref:Uncharacterized protein n=1 Tax=Salvia divinorum TaxID=28513 RepID=A0ABD1I1B5_SALDI